MQIRVGLGASSLRPWSSSTSSVPVIPGDAAEAALPLELILDILELSLEPGDINAQSRTQILRTLCLVSLALKAWAHPRLFTTIRLASKSSRRALAHSLRRSPESGESIRKLSVYALAETKIVTNGINSLSKSVPPLLQACGNLRTLVLDSAHDLSMHLLANCRGEQPSLVKWLNSGDSTLPQS